MRPYFNSFSPEVRAEAVKEAIAGFRGFFDGSEVTTRSAIVAAAATK
jgi:hypothetical protein